MPNQLRTFSYGGGVQSTAALVLAARGEIDYPIFLFANVGKDSELPDTLRYVREVAMPYAKQHGIELREVQKIFTRGVRAGQTETVVSRIMESKSSTVIPAYLARSGAPGNRSCTNDFKIKVMIREIRRLGATKELPAITGLGISIDEFQRMRTESGSPYQLLEYPLIDMRLTRVACRSIIEQAGLPVPPKSSCFFCPYQSMRRWRDLKEHHPDLWDQAVAIEQRLLEKRAEHNDAMYLTRMLVPLEQAIQGHQLELDFEDPCESGYCFT